MAAEVALGSLRYTLAALNILLATLDLLCGRWTYPCDQNIFRQRGVGILDLDEGELDAAI